VQIRCRTGETEKTKYNDHEKLKFGSFNHLEAPTKGKNNMQDNFNLVMDIHCK
jgi:hypothetical protein